MNPFLKDVAEDLIDRFGDKLAQCAIVFNNNRPATYLRKYLADRLQKPFFSPSIFTIQEFFSKSLNEQVADFYQQFFTLLTVYNQLLSEEGLHPVKSSQFFPLAKVILSDFAQIDNDLVDANKVYREMEDVALIAQQFDYLTPEQYTFLAQFWQSYTEGKHQKQQELFIRMWRRMPLLYHRFHEALFQQNSLTNGQVYRRLAMSDLDSLGFIQSYEGSQIIFVGFNALTRAEATVFTRLQESGKALFYFDTDEYYLNDELQEAGLFLRKNLRQLGLKNAFETSAHYFRSEKHEAHVYEVQGHTAQAKILHQVVPPHAATQGSGIAIILADESLLLPVLQTIEDHLNLNVTMGFALSGSTVYGLADLWLTAQKELFEEGKVTYATLAAFVTHPLTGLSTRLKANIQTALLRENVIHIEEERLLKQGGIFTRFFKLVRRPDALIPALLDILHSLLSRLSGQGTLKKIDADLFVKTIEELTRMNDVLEDRIGEEELYFVRQLLSKALQSIAVPLSGDPLDGIQVMGLLESRNLNFEEVIFLGFNEGIIPKTTIGNSFIPDSIRRAFGLPVLENLDAISSYMVYRLLQRARKISFVYNSLTDERNSGEVSRIARQLEYESSFDFHYHHLRLPISAAYTGMLTVDKKHPLIRAALGRYLSGERSLSPSALTQYIANPVDFFFKYIAEIKEPEEVSAVIEANQVGSILHQTMDYFYKAQEGKEVSQAWIRERRRELPVMIPKAFNKVMTNREESTFEYSGMQKVVLAIVQAYAGIILDRDEADAPFVIHKLEQKVSAFLDFELNGKPERIQLAGIIDRIDEKGGVTRIIDYKTGSDKLTFSSIEKLFDTNGRHINKAFIQTLIYTFTYEKQAAKEGVEPQLFVVKTMADGNVHFRSGRQVLKDDYLAEIKPLFLEELRKKVAELFNEEIPFQLSLESSNYDYSIYKTLFEV